MRSEDHHSATKRHLLETCVGSTTSVTERLMLMCDSWKRAAEDCSRLRAGEPKFNAPSCFFITLD